MQSTILIFKDFSSHYYESQLVSHTDALIFNIFFRPLVQSIAKKLTRILISTRGFYKMKKN